MKRFLPLVLIVVLAASANAQVSIGNRAGLSISHLASDDGDVQEQLEKDNNALLGVSVGLLVEVKVMDHLAFQTELGLTQKGHQIKEPKQDGYYRLRTNYGEGLLLAKGIFGKGSAKLVVQAGASFGRGLVGIERSATQVLDTIGNINFLDQRSDLKDFGPGSDELNRVEWSLVGGLGASFDLGKTRLLLEGRYVNGLTSIYNEPANGASPAEIFNRSILIQVGYLVQLDEGKKKEAAAPPAGPQY